MKTYCFFWSVSHTKYATLTMNGNKKIWPSIMLKTRSFDVFFEQKNKEVVKKYKSESSSLKSIIKNPC